MARDWFVLPERFAYLRPIAEQVNEVFNEIGQYYERLPDALTDAQIDALAKVYEEIDARGDAQPLSVWLEDLHARGGVASPQNIYRPVFDLFFLFRELGWRGVPPFNSFAVTYCPPQPLLDWTKLPEHLRYLAEPAEKFGKYTFEEEWRRFVENASEQDINELAAVSERIRMQGHVDEIYDWFRKHDVGDQPEAEKLGWMIELMKEADVPIEDDADYP